MRLRQRRSRPSALKTHLILARHHTRRPTYFASAPADFHGGRTGGGSFAQHHAADGTPRGERPRRLCACSSTFVRVRGAHGVLVARGREGTRLADVSLAGASRACEECRRRRGHSFAGHRERLRACIGRVYAHLYHDSPKAYDARGRGGDAFEVRGTCHWGTVSAVRVGRVCERTRVIDMAVSMTP